jgi:hypothetical protein
MDAKITLSFRADIIEKAKHYAENQGISLSRLTEILLSRLVKGNYSSIEDFPVSDWVNMLSEGETEYLRKPKTKKALKKEFYESRGKS